MEKMFKEQTIKTGAAKTKMIWTLGPASRSVVMIEKLLEAGMNVARFDFSEGSHAYHQETLNNLRTAIRNTGIICAVMLDTKGSGGEGEILTQKDKDDILQWGIPNFINIIALSFVRKGSDLDKVREFLGVRAKTIMLMSKFDNGGEEAAVNVDEIMEKTDAVMLARGNSTIVDKAIALGKPIVTAIQIIDGQTTDDLTNAVLDSTTDCLMVLASDDGDPDPATTLQRISSRCKELENSIDYKAVQKKIRRSLSKPVRPIEKNAAYACWNMKEAKAIIIVAKSAAGVVARCRPSVPILLVVQTTEISEWSSYVASNGLVSRGIIPLFGSGSGSLGEMVNFGVQVAKKEGICNAGDAIVALRVLNGSPVVLPLHVK